jgi:hypothetical protein
LLPGAAGTISPMAKSAFVPPPDHMLRLIENVRRWQKTYSMAADAVQRLQPVIDMVHRMEPAMATVQRMPESASTLGFLARQQETITRILASYRTLPVPTARELHEAEMELRTRLPQTSEDVDEVKQAVAEIEADPEQLSLIDRMTSGISRGHS